MRAPMPAPLPALRHATSSSPTLMTRLHASRPAPRLPSFLVATALAAVLASLAACGGSSGTAPTTSTPSDGLVVGATKLAYTDPAGTGWRLVRDAASTDSRLVLDLVGPADTTSRGVGFNLARGEALAFAKFPSGAYALDTGVFQLKGSNSNFEAYAGTPADPVLFVSAPLKGGTVLSTGIFQKDRTFVPKPVVQPLVQVAISLADAASIDRSTLPVGGNPYRLSVVKARMIPADIGGANFQLDAETLRKAHLVDVDVAVGTVVASK